MFGFIKKLKTVCEIPVPLSVRERALKVFSNIEALDDVKEMMLRALESTERAHTLLTGPPASAKSLFMLQIEKYMSSKVYFAEGAATTRAGIQKFIAENPHKEIIIIDEIDKMSIKDQEGLLTMMERGEFVSTKVRNTKTVKANMAIFATSNGTERLSKPLFSRFTVLVFLTLVLVNSPLSIIVSKPSWSFIGILSISSIMMISLCGFSAM
ncbi:MAG: AAA family ATPase, partial [Nitrososphaeraceae archaeon]